MFNIIVVDDEHIVKAALKKIIESAGSHYRVVGEASDGKEALELCIHHERIS